MSLRPRQTAPVNGDQLGTDDSAIYPRPVRLGISRTYSVELAPGIYRLMGKRSAVTGKFDRHG